MLHPTIALHSVCEITPELLESMGIRGLMLDIDNTLTTHDNPRPAKGVQAWIAQMKASGIQLRRYRDQAAFSRTGAKRSH